jgi:hypothetical protein
MSGKEMKNFPASVLARLRTISKSSGAPFQQVLQVEGRDWMGTLMHNTFGT